MINLIIKDGLGNQLFQYAYARYLQFLYNKELGISEEICINPFFLDHTVFKDNDERKMSLQHFKLCSNVRFLDVKEQRRYLRDFKIRTFLSTGIRGMIEWKVLGRKLQGEDWFVKRAKKGVYYGYYPYDFFRSPLSHADNKHIFGFFQSERYFHSISDTIINELQVFENPSPENQYMIDKITSCNSVCLHIRRGDYLNSKWKNLQICDFDYYNKAVNTILDEIDNPVFFVFSNTHDDLEWIKKNYKFEDRLGKRKINLIFVDLNNPDYEEIRLMYSCKHFIISNSTFSWWGAYLSKNNNKIVCVPDRWNLSSTNDINIYMSNWIIIK